MVIKKHLNTKAQSHEVKLKNLRKKKLSAFASFWQKHHRAPKKMKNINKRLLSFLPSFLLRHQISLDCKKRAKKQES